MLKAVKKQQKRSQKFVAALERSNNKIWGSHVRVPKHIVQEVASGRSRRVICQLNGETEFQCALLPFGSGQYVISINKKLCDTLGLDEGDQVNVRMRKDDSAYGLPVPDELEELLAQDREGNRIFHALTRGKQRTLLYIIGSVKHTEKRLRRALVIVRHLKANHGTVNYRQLAAALHDPRRQGLQKRD